MGGQGSGPACDSPPHLLLLPPPCVTQAGVSESMFLERREEDVLFRHYERRLLDFCNAFKPVMPKSVVVCTESSLLFNLHHNNTTSVPGNV